MHDLEFSSIEHFLKKCTVYDDEISCIFCCPITKEEYLSTAHLKKASQASISFYANLRNSILTAIKNSARLGHVGIEFFEPLPIGDYKKDEICQAIIDAFLDSGEFFYSKIEQKWISRRAAGTQESEFEKQIRLFPAIEAIEKSILIRVMVSLANVDGDLSPREMTFLQSFLEKSKDELINILAKNMPERAEFDQIARSPARETILMLAWTIALTDEKIEENERVHLATIAEIMDIPFKRSLELKQFAQFYILEKSIKDIITNKQWNEQTRSTIIEIGAKVGLNEELCDDAIEVYFRRNPIH